ncbi:MAG: hypothetical protein ACOY4K_13150 [Pseudomonadota bacterium]
MNDSLLMALSVAAYWLVLLSPILAAATFAALRMQQGQPVLTPSLNLLGPAIPWMVFFTYAALNQWEDVGHPREVDPMVGGVSLFVYCGTPVLAAVAVWRAKGYRWWALFVGVLNTVVGMATAFLGIMMTSGNWI